LDCQTTNTGRLVGQVVLVGLIGHCQTTDLSWTGWTNWIEVVGVVGLGVIRLVGLIGHCQTTDLRTSCTCSWEWLDWLD
jgi:hypothetical protein